MQTPISSQNHRAHVNAAVKRDVPVARLLKAANIFSRSMVSVTVSNTGKTLLVFVQPGAKVDSSCYCDVVVNQRLLPDIQKLSGSKFTFQQDGAPAHRS